MHRAGQQLSRINWNSLHLSAPELALMTGARVAEVLILAAACHHANAGGSFGEEAEGYKLRSASKIVE